MTNNEAPPLELSDIMHPLSPSPAPLPPEAPQEPPAEPPPSSVNHAAARTSRSPSPEPLDHIEFQELKQKIRNMGLLDRGSADLTPRERELATIVLRLTSMTYPDSSQLVRQAETIAHLTRQRDFLLRQAEEERIRWEAEREGWDRMAEALISNRSRGNHPTYREEELAREVHNLDSDAKALRQKLEGAHLRIQQLQNELTSLRPILLMEPLTLPDAPAQPKPTRKPKQKKQPPPSPIQSDAHLSQDERTEDAETHDMNDNVTATPNVKGKGRADHYRRETQSLLPSLMPQSAAKAKKTKGPKGRDVAGIAGPSTSAGKPLLADARAEHLLLAARKVGRERAGIMAGITRKLEAEEREREKQRKKEEEANARVQATPKTPRRTTAANTTTTAHVTPATMPHMNYHQQAYAYLPISFTGTPAGPVLVPIAPGHFPHLPQTPTTSRTSARTPSTLSRQQSSATPHTPLQSLIDAAAHVQGNEDEQGPSTPSGRNMRTPRPGAYGQVRPLPIMELPESPVPKRRRMAAASSTASSSKTQSTPSASHDRPENTTPASLTRESSGLDLLANQAVINSSQGRKDKGKGKEQASQGTNDPKNGPRKRGRPKGKGKYRSDIIVVSRTPTPDISPESEEDAHDSATEVERLTTSGVHDDEVGDGLNGSSGVSAPNPSGVPGEVATPALAPPITLERSRSEDGLESAAESPRNRMFLVPSTQLFSRRSSSIPPRFMRMPRAGASTDVNGDNENEEERDELANMDSSPGDPPFLGYGLDPNGWSAPESTLVVGTTVTGRPIAVTCKVKLMRKLGFEKDQALHSGLDDRPRSIPEDQVNIVSVTKIESAAWWKPDDKPTHNQTRCTLNGEILVADDLTPSCFFPGFVVLYEVAMYPFLASEFSSAGGRDTPLIRQKVDIVPQHGPGRSGQMPPSYASLSGPQRDTRSKRSRVRLPGVLNAARPLLPGTSVIPPRRRLTYDIAGAVSP
ncbi:hypothetical protein GLOTRDRAFT_135891 [Gloeophyllum trabeum ATCC 11539]|uniref:Uncharacterized protein n=1 Tax=Gloeophyllum trabeum (strain ATCC 11539 / FP-39264 / Madison 617) TaxID=670483 RepID=S7RZJ6_GLOTA|nr:uncharacterized protein GLOTRDRAFT_135891 [Gloeophyllum trabeum ATCC 11539]EPQ58874.1 hypothetical protein GLOTRDRAFT_135891 [Gloeophyllum trabeum ATCC 11539]